MKQKETELLDGYKFRSNLGKWTIISGHGYPTEPMRLTRIDKKNRRLMFSKANQTKFILYVDEQSVLTFKLRKASGREVDAFLSLQSNFKSNITNKKEERDSKKFLKSKSKP